MEQIVYCVHHLIRICVKWRHITVATIKHFMGRTIIHSDVMRKIIKNLEDYPVLKFRKFSFSGVEVHY